MGNISSKPNLNRMRSRDRYMDSHQDEQDEVNLNNGDTDKELQEPHFNEHFDQSPKNRPGKQNLHLGQLIFNNHNFVQNINMFPSSQSLESLHSNPSTGPTM